MPKPDLPGERKQFRSRLRERLLREHFASIVHPFLNLRGRRRGRGAADNDGIPVNPNRPNHLTGGAAAALDFESD